MKELIEWLWLEASTGELLIVLVIAAMLISLLVSIVRD